MDFSTRQAQSSLELKEKETHDIFIIPGNPGVKEYYNDYVEGLLDCLTDKSKVPFKITTVSHKGHYLDNQKDPQYGIHEQVDFHESFIQKQAQTSKGIILIGHSIGCYIILEMLRNHVIRSKIDKAILLFPTIERMKETPKGHVMTPIFKHVRFLVYLIAVFLSFLPYFLLRRIATLIVTKSREEKVSGLAIDTTARITLHPSVLRQVIYMAKTEMEFVRQPNLEVIEQCKEKLIFFYGFNDHWCPNEYYLEMKKRYPNHQIMQAPSKYRHDFVVNSSHEIAEISAKWILES